MRIISARVALVIALALALLTALPALSALADNGDGLESCNSGEICLYRDSGSDRFTRHFWWSATYDSSHQWWDTVDNQYEGQVRDTLSAVRNKDTTCQVRFTNLLGFWPDETWTVDNDSLRHVAPSYINNESDKHQRVNCS